MRQMQEEGALHRVRIEGNLGKTAGNGKGGALNSLHRETAESDLGDGDGAASLSGSHAPSCAEPSRPHHQCQDRLGGDFWLPVGSKSHSCPTIVVPNL